MARVLDQSKPYGEIHGAIGAMFEQDGVLFKSNGMEVFSGEVEHIIDEIAEKDTNEPLPYVFCVEQKSETSDPIETNLGGARDLDTMHWRHLKALVEVYGGTWENKEKAMAFLKGKA